MTSIENTEKFNRNRWLALGAVLIFLVGMIVFYEFKRSSRATPIVVTLQGTLTPLTGDEMMKPMDKVYLSPMIYRTINPVNDSHQEVFIFSKPHDQYDNTIVYSEVKIGCPEVKFTARQIETEVRSWVIGGKESNVRGETQLIIDEWECTHK